MRELKFRLLQVAAVFVMPFLLSACFPGSGGQQSGGSPSSGEFVGGRLVESFPNLPSYPEAIIVESYGKEQDGWGVILLTGDNLSKVVSFYTTALPTLLWEAEQQQQSDNNFVFDIKNPTHKGVVIVNTASDGKNTAISMFASKR